jgi:hypothetical protein
MMAQKISEKTKEGLSDAELKAAQKNPPGDTELSGAAPGAKAGEAADPGTLKTPRATERAERAADKLRDEVRDIQLDVHHRNVTNVPEYATETVYANHPEKGDPDSITIAQAGNGLIVTPSNGKPMHFDREHALALQRAVSHSAITL